MNTNIDQAAQAFNEWRVNRKKRTQTPTHLKALAVELVEHHPVALICERLKINSRSIKAWSEQKGPSQEFITLSNEAEQTVDSKKNGMQLKILAPGGVECHLSGDLSVSFIASLLRSMSEEVSP